MKKTVLIAGGTGFIGSALAKYLSGNGYRVHILARSSSGPNKNAVYFKWDIQKNYIDPAAFKDVTTIINLTGASIGEKRWTEKRKKEIIFSRTASTNLLFESVSAHNIPIASFISASAVGYYGAKTSAEILRETSDPGDDFLATVCQKWEAAARRFETLGCRVVILRQGVVIGKKGGMAQKLSPLARMGINTAVGSGDQYLPWISIRDVVRLYAFAIDNEDLVEVFNAVADENITMNDFSTALLRSFDKKSLLPNVPAFVIKLLYGEMSVMLLKGTRVSNEKIKASGFTFLDSNIEKAIAEN